MLVGSRKGSTKYCGLKVIWIVECFCPFSLQRQKHWNWGRNGTMKLNNVYRKRREKVFRLLKQLNCEFDESQAGLFVWAEDSCSYERRIRIKR